MSEKWYEGLPDDAFMTETDKIYEKAVSTIREGLEKGLDFDTACSAIEVEDETLRNNIIDDMLKVLISEEHFDKKIPLEDMAKKLKIPVERLESAKSGMLKDVRDSSIDAFYRSLGSGNA